MSDAEIKKKVKSCSEQRIAELVATIERLERMPIPPNAASWARASSEMEHVIVMQPLAALIIRRKNTGVQS